MRVNAETIINLVAGPSDDGRLDHICLVAEPVSLVGIAASASSTSARVQSAGSVRVATSHRCTVRDPDGPVVDLRFYG